MIFLLFIMNEILSTSRDLKGKIKPLEAKASDDNLKFLLFSFVI